MIKIFGFFLIAITVLVSCDKYQEIKKEDLSVAFVLNSSPTFKGYFYNGSDSAYHYFSSKWDYQRDRYFKIQLNSLKVFRIFDYNSDNKELRIDLFEENNEKFAENEFYKLYIVADQQ